ncbi:MAG: DegT/DnrJ/EryC1/StrS family aminotransferase [Acidobacteria bacterium]|nr:DegT/DnrJ/EryC1/StrS family aminotransferase [Acidobacteriota bacterium]
MNPQLRRKVALLDLHLHYEKIQDEIDTAIKRVFASKQFILGSEVKELEHEIAAYCHSDYAIGCASGSDAILLALMAYDIGVGDEVITTPYTFFATVGSIVRLGAKPVFVDIEESTFNMNPQALAALINDKTRAILPIHLFGQCADMEPIKALAKSIGIPVIEDAAQAIGAEYKGERAGKLGALAAFSFYPSKNLGGAGDGGMLTTDDAALAEKLQALRAHGARKKYFHDYVGLNSRLDSLQAAILRVKLKYLEVWSEARRENARRYQNLFSQTNLLTAGKVRLPVEVAGMRHVYNQYVIVVEARDRLMAYLKEQGIGTEIYYPLPLHLQTCFADLGFHRGDFPVSEKAAATALAIPVHPELTAADQQYVVESIEAFYAV